MFNISGLSRQEKPTSVQLHLQLMTSDQPAVVNITVGQEEFVWRQSEDTKNETEVKISLESLPQWTNDSLTIKVASTNPITLTSHHHYHPGLLIYMGGVPEAIDDLLATPLDQINNKDKFKVGIKKRRFILEETTCHLRSFTVDLSQLGGNYKILYPQKIDIGQCEGHCPRLPFHNPTKDTENSRDMMNNTPDPTAHEIILNIFKEGSGSGDVDSCTVRSFRPLAVLFYHSEKRVYTIRKLRDLVAESCECTLSSS